MATSWIFVYTFTTTVCAVGGGFIEPPVTTQLPGIPHGYILQVTPTCGADGVADASIDIITDLNAAAKAYCSNDVEVDFTSSDEVNFNLPVSYPSGGSSTCEFWKRQNSKVYAIKVVVSYGETGSFVRNYQFEYTVSCTFDPKGSDSSDNQNIIEGLIAPTELQTNVGSLSTESFTLELVDVLGTSLEGEDVKLGKMVFLQAITNAVSVRPVSCDAIDGNNKYAILRAGCGDGIVFNKTEGFTTSGSKTSSPYFEAFRINAAMVISFECIFIECLTGCDGSSCTNA